MSTSSARQLVRPHCSSFPLLCGTLFFLFCGPYEVQGPLMGWWLWPRSDGMVKPGCQIWQAAELDHDTRGLVASAHVTQALGARVFGVPAMAPLYHFALGWGMALALRWTGFKSKSLPVADRMLYAFQLTLSPSYRCIT